MKKVFLSIVMITLVQTTYTQNKSQVTLVNGIEVYILSEPIRDYEYIKSGGKGAQWGSFWSDGKVNESIATRVTKYIKKLTKYCDKQGITIDAIIYSNGKKVDAIKFTDIKTSDNDRIATVNDIDGITFFVLSAPIDNYEFVKTIGAGIKLKSFVTSGLLNNSIEQDLMKFAKKAKNKAKINTYNAIIYKHGKTAELIKI